MIEDLQATIPDLVILVGSEHKPVNTGDCLLMAIRTGCIWISGLKLCEEHDRHRSPNNSQQSHAKCITTYGHTRPAVMNKIALTTLSITAHGSSRISFSESGGMPHYCDGEDHGSSTVYGDLCRMILDWNFSNRAGLFQAPPTILFERP